MRDASRCCAVAKSLGDHKPTHNVTNKHMQDTKTTKTKLYINIHANTHKTSNTCNASNTKQCLQSKTMHKNQRQATTTAMEGAGGTALILGHAPPEA